MGRFVRSALLLVVLGGCAKILGLEPPPHVDEGAPGGVGSSDRGAGRAGADDDDGDWTLPANPEVGPCDGERDTFEARDGRIAVSGRCLQPMISSWLEFRACSQNGVQHFSISGLFELGNSALTLGGTFDAPDLQLIRATFPPIDAQVFDYHF